MLSEISIPGSGSSGTSFSGSQYRVLLADDDAGVRTSLAALLDGDGFLTLSTPVGARSPLPVEKFPAEKHRWNTCCSPVRFPGA